MTQQNTDIQDAGANHVPKVSVIVPVYKVEKYLPECIDSILAQTFTGFELILVDDGSPDNSGKICDDYAVRDSRIRVFHKENGGVSSARNFGARFARAEYIAFLDSDDWWKPEFLEKMYDLAGRHSSVPLCFCGYNLIFNNGKVDSRPLPNLPLGAEGEMDLFHFILENQRSGITGNLLYFPICTGTVLMTKSEFWHQGGFSENFSEGEDWKLWFECALESKFAFYNHVLFSYRRAVPVERKPRGLWPHPKTVWSASLSQYKDVEAVRPEVKYLLDRLRWLLLFRYKGCPRFRREMEQVRLSISVENSPWQFRFFYMLPNLLVRLVPCIRQGVRNFFSKLSSLC